MGELCAVEGDPNSHGAGTLIAAGDSSPQTVKINGKSVIVHESPANPDNLGHPLPPTSTSNGSGSVTYYGKPVHRNGDLRQCGATTIVTGQSSVQAGDAADVRAIAGEINVGVPVPFASEQQAAAVLQGTRDEAAAGRTTRRNDPFEYGDGGIGGLSPVNGAAGPQDTGREGPGAGPPAEGSEWLNFLPHTDSRVQPDLISKATAIAQAMNVQLTITSAYRNPEYNQRVGGAPNGYHPRGQALDITQSQFTQAQRQQFLREAVRVGIGGIGIYNSFTHIDTGPVRAWGPNGSRTSLPSWAAQTLQQAGRS